MEATFDAIGSIQDLVGSVQDLIKQNETMARAFLLFAVLCATYILEQMRVRWMRLIELNQWIQLARKQRDAKVHKVLAMHSSSQGEDKLLTASETRLLIASGKLDPKQNVVDLAKRSRKFGRASTGINSITEELYDDAYEMASSLDKQKSTLNPSNAPPLLGVPICVKDCVGLKGTLSTGGLACRLNRRDTEDSLIMKVIKEAGAIPLVKGNVVQGMGLSESYNRIWGRSRNPWDLDRSPGGSSGGDATLVSSGCVPLSISADGAGSIRIPASCCGVVGFKPSPGRLTFKGCMRPKKDDKFGSSLVIPAVIGPMARCVEDCALFMKAVCTPTLFKGDRNIPPMTFDSNAYESTNKLKIGYFVTDDWLDPVPTVKRAIQETVEALEKQGHTLVPFKPPTNGWEHNRLFAGITAAEGNMKSYREGLEGEPMIPEYAPLVAVSALPNFMRPLVKLVLPERLRFLMNCGRNGGLSAYQVWDLTADLMKMRQQWSDAFNQSEVDAVIFPSLPIPAIAHGKCGKIMSVSYMFIGNLLSWPCGSMPITTIREDEQSYRKDELPKVQRDIMASYIDQELKGSAGLPMSISVMTAGFEDEKCLRVMKEIEKGATFQARPTAFEAQTYN